MPGLLLGVKCRGIKPIKPSVTPQTYPSDDVWTQTLPNGQLVHNEILSSMQESNLKPYQGLKKISLQLYAL